VLFEATEWDENNLDHACRRVSATEIEQVITNAIFYRRHQQYADRVLFTDLTDGGKRGYYDKHRELTPWVNPSPQTSPNG